jgi:hypothetical protein
LWENPKPSSTRYCRPIKFLYTKETPETTRTEVQKVEQDIENLQTTEIVFDHEKTLTINYTLIMTIIDEKFINVLTDTSSQKCFICQCNPKAMNDLENLCNFDINIENIKYGLSTLHAWIKFLECILHIAYKLSIPTTNSLTQYQKLLVDERKKKFKIDEMGLKVDRVVQDMGTSNTGNVARRFFKDPEMVSEITGANVNLIQRFSTILTVISSGLDIYFERFDNYAKETVELYVHLYNWYRMPSSVHKVIIHGSIVIKYVLLPIGQLSEEAQKSRNKDYLRYREHHSRKSSRINTNSDLIHFLLISSDPLISSLSPPKKKM